MQINANFDSGNIEVLDIQSPENILLKIRNDSNANYAQWFHFCLREAKGVACQMKILNAGETSYPNGWHNYRVCVSYDRHNWFRIPTQFDGKALTITHRPQHDVVYYAFFAPYTYEQHLDLLSWAQLSPLCQLEDLGLTLDGRPLTLVRVGEPAEDKKKIWLIARQHCGETMAEWFAEGWLGRLLDSTDPVSRALLQSAVFYVVPNMNPDGSVRGNLRANAAGTDLNRAWKEPSLEASPEVFHVRKKMLETGVDFFIDAHGDEEIPYVFIATANGEIPSYTEQQKHLEERFRSLLLQESPDFQTKAGYEPSRFGEQSLCLAGNYVAAQFGCFSATLEMPFHDNANLPDAETGWSPMRSKHLAHACLNVVLTMLPELR